MKAKLRQPNQIREASGQKPFSARGKEPRKTRRSVDLNHLIYGALALFAVMFLYRPIISILTKESQVPRLQREIVLMQKENERLEAEIELLKTREGVEMLARKDWGMVKEDEESFVVVEEDGSAGSADEKDQDRIEGGSLWQGIERFFVNLWERAK